MRRNIILMVVMFIFAACDSYDLDIKLAGLRGESIYITALNKNGAEIEKIIINDGSCKSTLSEMLKKYMLPEIGQVVARIYESSKDYIEANKDIFIAFYTKQIADELHITTLETIKNDIKSYQYFKEKQAFTDKQMDDLAEAIFNTYNPMKEKLLNFAVETILNDEYEFDYFRKELNKLQGEVSQKERVFIYPLVDSANLETRYVYTHIKNIKNYLNQIGNIGNIKNKVANFKDKSLLLDTGGNKMTKLKMENTRKEAINTVNSYKAKGIEFTEEQIKTEENMNKLYGIPESIGKLPPLYMTVYKVKSVPKQEVPTIKLQYGKTIKDTTIHCPMVLKVEIVTKKASEIFEF